MYKLKSNSGAGKRFRKTANKGLKCRRANRAHIKTKQSQKTVRQSRRNVLVNKVDKPSIDRLLHGC